MALNSLLCADVPLRTYTLTLDCVFQLSIWFIGNVLELHAEGAGLRHSVGTILV